MCLTSIQDTSFLNRIGPRISARSYEQKQRGVNRSNLITISPIFPVQTNQVVNVLKSDSTKNAIRKGNQNHTNLIPVQTQEKMIANSSHFACSMRNPLGQNRVNQSIYL